MQIKVAQYIEKCGLDVEVIPGYSGRGMCGGTTAALATKMGIKNILISLAHMALEVEPGSQEAAELLQVLNALDNVQEDSLGLRTV